MDTAIYPKYKQALFAICNCKFVAYVLFTHLPQHTFYDGVQAYKWKDPSTINYSIKHCAVVVSGNPISIHDFIPILTPFI